jgi:protein SCO1
VKSIAAALLAAAALAAGLLRAESSLAPLEFVPPPAGSYRLERIFHAPQGTVLDANDQRRPLSAFTTGRITLLSFIYTYCSDRWGCPLAYEVMDAVKEQADRQPQLRRHLRLVSLSFDPERDTPERMQLYGGSHVRDKDRLPWFFLTTASPGDLKPLLQGFDQDLSVVLDQEGRTSGALSHVLKVFLIDRVGDVREIYSTAYLQPAVVLNDIKTLLLEEGIQID